MDRDRLLYRNNRILIFDGESDLIETVTSLLSNFTVQSTNSYLRGREILEGGYSPGLIIMDPHNSMGEGFRFLEYIRNRDFLQSILVITGDDQAETFRLAAKYGAVGLIQKPFLGEDLLRSIEAVLRSSRLMALDSELVRSYGDLVLRLKMQRMGAPDAGSVGLSSALILLEEKILGLLEQRENLLKQAAFQGRHGA